MVLLKTTKSKCELQLTTCNQHNIGLLWWCERIMEYSIVMVWLVYVFQEFRNRQYSETMNDNHSMYIQVEIKSVSGNKKLKKTQKKIRLDDQDKPSQFPVWAWTRYSRIQAKLLTFISMHTYIHCINTLRFIKRRLT